MRATLLWQFSGVLACFLAINASAGTFFSDFNSGLPENTLVFGDATVGDNGGVGGSGVLRLTVAQVSQMGCFIIQPLDGKDRMASFIAHFKAYIGGGSGADGFAFHFAPNLPDAPFADPPNHGLQVVFDTFKNGGQIAPGIRVTSYGGSKSEFSVPELRADHFVDVMIKLDPDGTLDLTYDRELIFTNLPTTVTNTTGRFALGARTGSRVDNHFIDDLNIVTQTSPRAFVETFEPTGNDASPSPLVDVLIRNFKTGIRAGSVKLELDGKAVAAEVSSAEEGTLVHFEPTALYEPGSNHTVTLRFSDTGRPEASTEFTYGFKISSQVIISK